MQTKIVFASLLATAVAQNHGLFARQVDIPGIGTISKECEDDLDQMQKAGAPSLPVDVLMSAGAEAATMSDPCAWKPTGSLSSEIASFTSAAESWSKEHKSLYSKAEQDCKMPITKIGNACPSGASAFPTTSGADKTSSGAGAEKTSGAKATDKPSGAASGPVAAGALMVAAVAAALL